MCGQDSKGDKGREVGGILALDRICVTGLPMGASADSPAGR